MGLKNIPRTEMLQYMYMFESHPHGICASEIQDPWTRKGPGY